MAGNSTPNTAEFLDDTFGKNITQRNKKPTLLTYNSFDALTEITDQDESFNTTSTHSFELNRSLPNLQSKAKEDVTELRNQIRTLEENLKIAENEIENLLLENSAQAKKIANYELRLNRLSHLCSSTTKAKTPGKIKSKAGSIRSTLNFTDLQSPRMEKINTPSFDRKQQTKPVEDEKPEGIVIAPPPDSSASPQHKNSEMSSELSKVTMDKSYQNKMKDEPLIPVGACVACASTALAAQEFRLFVRNSEKTWWKAIQSLAILPYTAIPPVKSVCAFIKPNDLSIQTFKDYTQGDARTILNRMKNRVSKKPIERKPRGARSGPSCNCPDCGKTFLSPYFLNMHLKNSGHKEACQICGSVCVRGKEMQDHLSSVHNEIALLCKQCPILLTNEIQLKKHLKKAHKAGALTCSDCGRSFPRQTSFETHSQMHAVRTCRACGVQFTNRGCYREHRSQCEPDAKPNTQSFPRNRRSNIRDPAQFTCDHCGKTYNSRPQLKNHIIWIHMNIRPHQCQWCGKRFYTPARLAEHTVVHTRVRNFECDICGVKLVSKMAAVYHRRRHTGERPYECEDCGEKFISASRRSEHAKRRHNKGYRLPCSKCPANFVRKHELKKHMEKAHGSPETILPW